VVTDGHVSVLGALGPEDGIVVAIGTGSVFVRQLAGQHHQIGGKGLVLGDEASGAWIGRRLLSLALRAMDGFRPMTPLLQDVLRDMGGAEGMIAFSIRARPSDFAALAGRVTGSEDPAAREIMDEAKAECLRAIEVLQAEGSLPVVCLGGLAHVFAPVVARHHRVLPPRGTALDGAVLLSRRL
jgi:glucosamine kinase